MVCLCGVFFLSKTRAWERTQVRVQALEEALAAADRAAAEAVAENAGANDDDVAARAEALDAFNMRLSKKVYTTLGRSTSRGSPKRCYYIRR